MCERLALCSCYLLQLTQTDGPTIKPSWSARLKQELDVKQHGLGLLRQRIAGSESAQLAEAVKASEQELVEAKEAAAAAQQKRKDMVDAAKVCPMMLQAAGNTSGLPRCDPAFLPVAGGLCMPHRCATCCGQLVQCCQSKPDESRLLLAWGVGLR